MRNQFTIFDTAVAGDVKSNNTGVGITENSVEGTVVGSRAPGGENGGWVGKRGFEAEES